MGRTIVAFLLSVGIVIAAVSVGTGSVDAGKPIRTADATVTVSPGSQRLTCLMSGTITWTNLGVWNVRFSWNRSKDGKVSTIKKGTVALGQRTPSGEMTVQFEAIRHEIDIWYLSAELLKPNGDTVRLRGEPVSVQSEPVVLQC